MTRPVVTFAIPTNGKLFLSHDETAAALGRSRNDLFRLFHLCPTDLATIRLLSGKSGHGRTVRYHLRAVLEASEVLRGRDWPVPPRAWGKRTAQS